MNGTKLKNKKINKFKKRFAKLAQAPHLVMIQIGNNTASSIYLKHKQNTCKEIGIKSTKINLKSNITFEQLKKQIDKLNNDKNVDGILVQFPLPKKMSRRKVALLINPEKDADGIHPLNQGVNVTNTDYPSLKPCTPSGIMEILKEYKISISKKFVVVIGRSNIVGKPLAHMMLNEDATTSQIHRKTTAKVKKDLLKAADIIVTATGSKDVFYPKDVKKNVVIIDVGIIKEKGKLRGDIEYKKFKNKASYITPVPGGVGPMTVAMLMQNVLSIKEKKER